MNILVFNCGSSSLKFRLIAMPDEKELISGEAQRIGPPTALPSKIIYRVRDEKFATEIQMADHEAALRQIMTILTGIPDCSPDLVAHRLVHGGSRITATSPVTSAVAEDLRMVSSLAPLHNPPAIAALEACRKHFPHLSQVVVSDTAYHNTIPEHAAIYALPKDLRTQTGIRKYGFVFQGQTLVIDFSFNILAFRRFIRFVNVLSSSICLLNRCRSLDTDESLVYP